MSDPDPVLQCSQTSFCVNNKLICKKMVPEEFGRKGTYQKQKSKPQISATVFLSCMPRAIGSERLYGLWLRAVLTSIVLSSDYQLILLILQVQVRPESIPGIQTEMIIKPLFCEVFMYLFRLVIIWFVFFHPCFMHSETHQKINLKTRAIPY